MSEAERAFPTTVVTDGAAARAVGLSAGVLQLVVDRAYPPGKPLELRLEGPAGPLELQGKSAGSKRRDDGSFLVRIKLLSLRREHKAELDTMFTLTE